MAHRGPTALVAEDTDLGRWALAHALQGCGFDTYMAGSTLEAIDWTGRVGFSVVILAVRAAIDDAGGVVRHVRRQQPEAVLIVLAEPDDVRRVRDACEPLAIVVAKPLDVEAIVRLTQFREGRHERAQGA